MERIFQECVEEIKEQEKVYPFQSYLSEVERLCDRVAIIREGNIIETGSINQLRHLTQTIFKVETVKEVRSDKLDGINDSLWKVSTSPSKLTMRISRILWPT